MLVRSQRGGRRPAAAAVEFALLAPLLLLMLMAIWELGRVVEVKQILETAAREAGRQAASGKNASSTIEQLTQTQLTRAGLPSQAVSNATIRVTNLTSGKDATSSDQLDHFQITITVRYQDVSWVNLHVITNSTTTLTVTTDWYSMRDLPITVTTEIPLQ